MSDGLDCLRRVVASLPRSPGVYRMYDGEKRLLYIGKAKNLSARVKSYTQVHALPTRLKRLVANVREVQTTQTRTEGEALLLEAHLIQKHKPPYNIVFKDNKSMPYLRLTGGEWPRLMRHRGALNARDHFFGPYPSVTEVASTQKSLQKLFKLRTCSDPVFKNRTRPCLQYHIKRCSAPCVGLIDAAAYANDVRHLKAVLAGRSGQVQKELIANMQALSDAQRFEEAAKQRDRLHALSALQQKQALHLTAPETTQTAHSQIHVWHAAQTGEQCVVYVLFFQEGHLLGGHPLTLQGCDNNDALTGFVAQFYQHTPLPRLILTGHPLLRTAALIEALAQQATQPFTLRTPCGHNEKQVVSQAGHNAENALSELLSRQTSEEKNLKLLSEWFNFKQSIQRVEVYDNAHLHGTHPYGAMVVATLTGFDKKAYRLFRVPSDLTNAEEAVKTDDDYALMRYVIKRRFKEKEGWPHLLLLDGGKGHLNAVRQVLLAMNVRSIPVLAIAKGPQRGRLQETFYSWTPSAERDNDSTVQQRALQPGTPLYFYLERLRDEAHRFGNTRHHSARRRALKESALDRLPGVGPKRKKHLMHFFGSMQAVREAPPQQLALVPGFSKTLAHKVYTALHHDEDTDA